MIFKKAGFLGIVLFLVALSWQATAQIDPLGASYFQNQYLNNPALAGSDRGLTLSMGLRKQLTSIPGSPVNQMATVEYGFGNKVGAGVNIYNDQAGIFRTTRIVASYSYYLLLGNNQRVYFGLSAGFLNRHLDNGSVNGDQDDTQLVDFNKRDTYIDGDFGLAYTSNKLSAQLAFPQLKNVLKRDANLALTNYPTFFSSLSYKIRAGFESEDLELEPKLCYRGMRGSENVLDVGTNIALAGRRLNVFAMYHTSQSCTFGVGMRYKSVSINGAYATGTSAIRNYSNGDFEMSLKVGLF